MYLCVQTTGMSAFLPSYGGAGLGRGVIQNRGAPAASEVSIESSSLSYGTSSRPDWFAAGSMPPVGRGLPVGRGQYLLSQTAGTGIGKDSVCCCS